MKWKAYIPLFVAMALGLIAARIAMTIVAHAPHEEVQKIALVQAMVATRDIEPGTTLTELDVHPAAVNAESMASGTYTTAKDVVGKVTKIALVRDQTLMPNLMADDGAGYGVGATLPAGMRAVTVDVTDTTGVNGFILPKSKVDVIATLGDREKAVTRTVMENVTVVAMGTRTNPQPSPDQAGQPPQPIKTATLLVSPKDAERIELAATVSRIRLSLRNGLDKSTVAGEGVSFAELTGRADVDGDGPVRNASSTTQPAIIPVLAPATQPAMMPVAQVVVTPLPPLKKTWSVQVIRAGVVSSDKFVLPADGATTQPSGDKAADRESTDPFADDNELVHVDANH